MAGKYNKNSDSHIAVTTHPGIIRKGLTIVTKNCITITTTPTIRATTIAMVTPTPTTVTTCLNKHNNKSRNGNFLCRRTHCCRQLYISKQSNVGNYEENNSI